MKKKLTYAYLSVFCAEMSVIFRAGIALGDGVRVLLADADKDGKAVLQGLLDELVRGEPFFSALDKSGYFPGHMIGVVRAGEKTGRIVEMLKALSEYYDRLDRLAVTVKNAVFFPLILLAMMIGVVLILITQVLPIFSDVFGRLGARMSPLAASFMRFGEWLSGVSLILALIFGVLLVFALVLRVFPAARARVFKMFKERFGGLGVFGETASYHFISVMALALESGLKAKEAVELASAVSGGTKAADKKNAECARLLSEGGALADAMGGAGILSAREAQLLNFGARGGVTDATMAEITSRKERELLERINRLVSRVEPALIIVISIIVGVVLLSVMAPLMGIMNSIGG
ncbi:MAG: type II secretion system F family protein [Oscillospiraceae bacterium]|nr:type II secretion system F family protein [Oscillospiraceae bacterium]